MMNLAEYQPLAARTAAMPNIDANISLAVFALGLVCEATEVQRWYTDEALASDRTSECITKELGDVMWYAAALCSHYNLSLPAVVGQEIEFTDRDLVNGDLDVMLWVHSLTNCAGTVSDHIKKTLSYGPDHSIDKDRLSLGLQNIVVSVHRVCVADGLVLSDVMTANIKKLEKRHPKGFTAESSLARVDVSKPDSNLPPC